MRAEGLPGPYQEVLDSHHPSSRPLCDVERERFGATHAEVGVYLLALWGFPTPVVQAVAQHHCPGPSLDKAFSALTALHVANGMEHERGRPTDGPPSSQIEMNYLAGIGLKDLLEFWRELTTGPVEQNAA